MPREEIEKRELIMMCYLSHDSYRVLGDAPAADGERRHDGGAHQGNSDAHDELLSRAAAGDRWYVRSADMEPVRDLCAAKR